ncbi:aminoglycoside phosphotransferase family protein [Prescottella agglutinans]|uniref:Streptomycin 6-kinase n=1 Tax=Prescottella agglutinans TaxID=1644129 RepID=A0ABT6MHK4_9NOCA|nr:aminoglycoside phosphotransferase family protein [Prescottella agglutinans]MDH6283800.1 streptomycin 6-kinase [Prescottella agglutinans]
MIEVPAALAAAQYKHGGVAGRAFVAALPRIADQMLDRWNLTPTGEPMHGWTALVLPVQDGDGRHAVLKLQAVDEETAGEPVALRMWDGDGAVRLLADDPGTGAMLLERLDASRHLTGMEDSRAAVRILAGLLARLTAHVAPTGMRKLGDVADAMLQDAPDTVRLLADAADRRLLADCAAAVRDVVDEPGNRLLHWDLHYDNVLASEREPWLAIDPKPLAGDPGFELLPALTNRFDPAEITWRFDLMTDLLGLDRGRALAWTLGRILQNGLWDIEDGERRLAEEQVAIARILLAR